ncbi:MAG: fibronectin type III domain-containing protein [Methanomassiliicoccales archaeon]|jgi:hypothetical protein
MAALLVAIVVVAVAFLAMDFVGDDPEPPGVPLNVVLVGGEGEVGISWDAPADNGSSDVVSYTVYLFLTADAGRSGDSGPIDDERFIWTGLSGETRYYFAVSASNEDGEGPMTDLFQVTTLEIVEVPDASNMCLDADEVDEEFDLDSYDTIRPTDLIALGLRDYVMAEYSVTMTDPLNDWRFVTIEIGVCATPEEAEILFASMFENYSISADPADYEDMDLGDESKYYKYPALDGLILDGWFRSGSVVVHMEFDSSEYEISVTEDWFDDLMEEQLAKVIADSDAS